MIRSATALDASILTGLSRQSKNYWDYPQEYFLIWEDELNITPEYIDEHQVFVYEVDARILADPNSRGFYDKMGCTYKGEQPSSIANRTTPLYLLEIPAG